MNCIHCGAEMKDNQSICEQCGKPVGTEPNAVEQTQAAEMPENPAVERKKWSRKRNFVFAGAVSLILALAIVGTIVYSLEQRREAYFEQMETGYRFLGEGNYSEAILAFEAAIEIDPRIADAYVGLGDAKIGYGAETLESRYFEEAINNYQDALELNPAYVEAYLGLATAYLELGRWNEAVEVLEKGFAETGDERLSGWLEALRESGAASLSGVVSEYLLDGGTAVLPGARVRFYLKTEGSSYLVRFVESGEDGTFHLGGLAAGEYELHVDAEDHIGIRTQEILQAGEERYTDVFLMIPDAGATTSYEYGNLRVSVINALNGNPVPDAEIYVRNDWNSQEGETLRSIPAVTDELGTCQIENLAYGYYTVEIRAEDFVTTYYNTAVTPEEYWHDWTASMTPVLKSGEIRIVLTWGENPRDLDSHLVGEDFHVYYGILDHYDDLGRYRVNLDLDDTTSYGPETVTILQGVDGVYTYSVYDYTNGGASGTNQLSNSGATVRIYQEEGLAATYHVPVGKTGYTWTVFRIYEDGTLETVNTVDESYP